MFARSTFSGPVILLGLLSLAPVAGAQQLRFAPYHPDGTYGAGETVGWRVTPAADSSPVGRFTYSVRRDGNLLLDRGSFDVSGGSAVIETSSEVPGMLLVEIRPPAGMDGFRGESLAESGRVLLGAAVAPGEIRPAGSRPQDFDAFWSDQIRRLEAIPADPVVTPGESGVDGVEYAQIRLDNVDGAHVHAQLARPVGGTNLPALLIFQWASPPYPLEKSWVTDRAAEGWLVLNVEPHDVPVSMPQTFYDALPAQIKSYHRIGRRSRDDSYFLTMYLGDYRAVEYMTSRPDWDGRTLVVMGTSMGGQQSLSIAGLHPKVNGVIVNVPSGADVTGPLHGRAPSYPGWEVQDPRVLETAPYFDPANFAPRIRARTLVSLGFIDETSTPTSVWSVYNGIQVEKEVVPLIDAPHNHLSTPAQAASYERRAAEWLRELVTIPPPVRLTSEEDHARMMALLGITWLRPGADGSDPNAPNAANYDEALANPYPDLPDPLRTEAGEPVETPEHWWSTRRPEIVEAFDREVYGRVPEDVPDVRWDVARETEETHEGVPVITKELLGHVDNSGYPHITVDIRATVTTPRDAGGPVPVVLQLGGTPFLTSRPSPPGAGPPVEPAWSEQVLARGWGFATLDTYSVQADSGEGLTRGIIGLVNRGAPRSLEDWGALRAWAWGVSRAMDYFERDPDVDATRVAVEGHSRWGKAALVAMAYDSRIATAYVSSSGAAGAKLHRRNAGEIVENVAGRGEYHWMAGNYIKYAGPLTWDELPVDSHELIAMCAPRPVFIGSGDRGDDWVDPRGMYMAAAAAGPVYELLGRSGLGERPFPPVGTAVLDGAVAFRQHPGGHTDGPNWPAFLEFAARYLGAPL
jgi:cephalosporin-C deacetylase-like acetyl esterase